MDVELIQGLLLAFALIVILMPPYIRLLKSIGFGKRIRVEGPESHYTKEGTPTMGGLLIVVVVVAIYAFFRGEPDAATFAPLAALTGVGLLGAFDDYLNAKTGEGIRARQKLVWLTVVAFVAAWQIQQTYAITAIAVPFVGAVAIEPWLYVLFGAFAIVAAANGVNLTDGLDGLSGGGLAGLTAAEVTGAVLARADSGVSVSAAQYFVCALRALLRFCFVEGLLAADLSQAALAVGGRRSSPLPKGIGRADARALLGACDRRRALGRRDYALIILLLRLGLRAGEVARVSLDDIDWRAGELVVRGKGAREDRLPLPADVGEAIAAYLRRGRPPSPRRELFLRARAPYEPIAPATVRSTVRRACRRAGIPELGSHRLRHTAACEMVAAHVPLERIGQVLRHRSLQSTAIYARVDVDGLRPLAKPWPRLGAQR